MVKHVTNIMDSSLDQLAKWSGGTDNKWAFHLFVFFVNCMLSIPNVVAYFVLDANTHVIFWMGLAPTYINLLVPITLFSLSLTLPVLNYINMSNRNVRIVVFSAFILAGIYMFVAGFYVLYEVYEVSGEVSDGCGISKLSKAIQTEWERLAAFHKQCDAAQKKLKREQLLVDECPGFPSLRKGHDFYVDYIQQMEEEYDCRGFCKAAARPLFNKDNEGRGERCSTAIKGEVERVAFIVGMPTVCSGVFVFLFGQCLFSYDHL